jgi:hypothetical protein
MHAPPEASVRTQTSFTAQLDDPQEVPGPPSPAVDAAAPHPAASARASKLANENRHRLMARS